jgi:exodeoxyribonuclease VII large subunit
MSMMLQATPVPSCEFPNRLLSLKTMPKVTNSQWNFDGVIPPSKPPREVPSVSELTSRIKRMLEKELKDVQVTGEISGLKHQPSGHAYFVLKDAGAQLSCVLFRGELQVDRSLLQDGRKVVLKGQITVYEPRGTYQLRVIGLEAQGAGALQAAFEKLKEKLKAEGMFAMERKRPIPRFPLRIGLVTSPAGAAIRDVLHVIERRNPGLQIVLAACRVQGAGAAAEIARSITLLNKYNETQVRSGSATTLDLILVTRGGGSLEDLWCFNEEVVARAIFNSQLPVVSAVGHEIDFTISDFVADLRAATPSAAAELITEGAFSSCQALSSLSERLGQLARRQLFRLTQTTAGMMQRFARAHPRRSIESSGQRVDEALSSLARCVRQGLRRDTIRHENLANRLARVRPAAVIKDRREHLALQLRRIRENARNELRELQARTDGAASRLRLLGPEQVMARGYSITVDASGRVLRDAATVRHGQRIRTRLQQGEITSRVERPSKTGDPAREQPELPL